MLRREVDVLRAALEDRIAEWQTGRPGTTYTVARLPIVIGARALIADNAAMLPLVDVRGGELVEPTPSILLRPDPAMSRRRLVHRAAMSLSGWGNLYVYLTRLGYDAWPLTATVQHPDTVAAVYAGDGSIIGWNIAGRPYPLEAVVHVPLWETDLAPVARSPLAECQQALDDLAVLWSFATGYYRDGGLPPYVLNHPGRLNPEQSEELIGQWLEARRLRRPGVLSGNITIEGLPTPSAADALLLDGLAYIDQTVTRLYGITPTLLNVRAVDPEQVWESVHSRQNIYERWISWS